MGSRKLCGFPSRVVHGDETPSLHRQLTAMGRRNYKRLCKAHVLEIFKVLGYPDGYEHYETINKILTTHAEATAVTPSMPNL